MTSPTRATSMLLTLVSAALVVLMISSAASAQIVEVEGRYWFTDFEARLKIKNHAIPGTNIDLEHDLGLERENAPEGRVTFFAPFNNRIRLAYTRLDFEAAETLSRTITFAGETFSANSRVKTDLELHYGRVGWIWQPLGIPGVLKFGGLLEAKGLVLDASLRTRGSAPEVKESVVLPLILPTIGLALDVTPFAMLHLFAEASGLPAGDLGHVFDAEAGLRFIPIRVFSLAAGYRIFDVRVDEGGDFGKLRLSGPFVGASFRF